MRLSVQGVSAWDNSARAMPVRLRWGGGFVLVAALFTGSVWLAVHWAPHPPPEAAPPAAVIIDLAPLPAAPPAPHVDVAPGPQQTLSQPPPPAPEIQPPLPEAPPSPAPAPAVPVPPKLKPKPVHHKPAVQHVLPKPVPDKTPPVTQTSAPPQVQAPPAAAAAAPRAEVQSSNTPSNAVPSWQGELLSRLERFKRYPALAQERDEEGTAYLHFSMDRDGNVLSAQIVKSSGFADLDDETLALLRRAQPLPKPPPEVPGNPVELTVPVQFYLQGGG